MVAIMYVERIKSKQGNKSYEQILLRESYRKPGAPRSKVKHRTLLNLTHHDPKEIEAIELGLKHKNDLDKLRAAAGNEIRLKQGKSVGAVWVLWRVAQKLGFTDLLCRSQKGRLALWQVMARIINQGSRLSAVRLAYDHAACEILSLDDFDENDLYASMDRLDERQAKIEYALFKKRHAIDRPHLFLYDVTSSYLEGDQNEYAAYGYNRDGKRGKLQIVVGLLTDSDGAPVSVEVFDGNTHDTKTVLPQVRKIADRFGVKKVTFVGDRGMIKSAQIDELREESFYYLTAITKPQIESLIKQGVLQLGMFEEKVCEVGVDDARYVLRRNPVRAGEIAQSRDDKLRSLREFADERSVYLRDHIRAKVDIALRDVEVYASKLRLDDWTQLRTDGREISVNVMEEELTRVSRLDGCYALKTDAPAELADTEQVHNRYKDLAQVEKAFRTMKTGHLEIRPVFVRTAAHTRAHVFIVMLAYLIRRELDAAWRALDLTVEEGIDLLSTLCADEVSIGTDSEERGYLAVPDPRDTVAKLFAALDITPPTTLPRNNTTVATKQKLPDRRI